MPDYIGPGTQPSLVVFGGDEDGPERVSQSPSGSSFERSAVFDELFFATEDLTRGDWVMIDTGTAVPALNPERQDRQCQQATAGVAGTLVLGVVLETITGATAANAVTVKVRRRGLVSLAQTATTDATGASDPGFEANVASATALDSPLQVSGTAGRASIAVIGTDHIIGVSRTLAALNVAAVEVQSV